MTKLRSYLRDRGIRFDVFASSIGKTENIVRKWAYGQRQPSLRNAVEIEDATEGALRPRDLLLPADRTSNAEAA